MSFGEDMVKACISLPLCTFYVGNFFISSDQEKLSMYEKMLPPDKNQAALNVT